MNELMNEFLPPGSKLLNGKNCALFLFLSPSHDIMVNTDHTPFTVC